MQGIKEYLLGVIAAAILCAIVTQLVSKESLPGAAMKLICGVFMLLALVSPVTQIRVWPSHIFSDLSLQADLITTAASESSQESIAQIIKEQTQAYILDKASSQGVSLSVSVTLSDSEIPKPIGVTLTGSVSPYTKKVLSETIEKDLGIAAEAQIWK